MKHIIEKIKEYDKIIIARHKLPDMDALGSQYGLANLIKNTFKDKQVYTVGSELPQKYAYIGELDNLDKEDYKDALFISVDTPALHMLDAEHYDLCDYRIKIDHHVSREDFFDYQYVDTSKESNASIIFELADKGLVLNEASAYALMNGIVSDSGRFLYSQTNKETFLRAAKLMEYGIDLDSIYKRQYKTTVKQKKLESYVLANFNVLENIAYIIYEEEMLEKYDVSLAYLKSGTVNMMSNIDTIDAWMTFTKVNDLVMVELRGVRSVVNVCIKYGGGGHHLACGCTIKEEQINDFMKDVIEELKC